jgi:hypothetical protein
MHLLVRHVEYEIGPIAAKSLNIARRTFVVGAARFQEQRTSGEILANVYFPWTTVTVPFIQE